jgi:hypothetical protein
MLAVEQRLSWQAVLADRFDGPHVPVTWDRPWNDSLNEAFVRRRLPEFQNPAIEVLTGVDGFPATHFVGVAGVGGDAAGLDVRDPRAGIFGFDRTTRVEDIRDGASNTGLVIGVRDRLGSWAAGGHPTVRALTREPYVNGPDGFGTGQAGAMLVLMADGRVQWFSAATDPRILRAMAAMADGQPFADPGVDSRADPVAAAANALVQQSGGFDRADDRPLEPEFGPGNAPRKVEIPVSLRQPIVRFEQPKSRPLSDLLPALAEMVGAPIRFDAAELGAAAAGLKTPVQLHLENTTVGDILDGLLKPAGLAYRVESDHVRLVPRP